MEQVRQQSSQAALMSLEAAAASARGGFACIFSTSDEYETALITERRAQGHYAKGQERWPLALFVACALGVVGAVLLFG
ncbi:hypothetical protein JQ596_28420 [Bradyrhizobium manausense]|uniref:hypothetical protein n=1 Tax=Bradyrhizobium TaxID=374 RepID=UPI001BAC9E00|nr:MULTISPECIES: hypothetical protein [Bradyrhizobium]MBR0829466.1 hypothetical protein [Bradyrhizobium manausense]UVO25841.1 hypothetical protein KUF59_25060 [Bradyrhizobium arachidis]